MTRPSDFLVALNDLVVLRIDGEDAASFLHSQLSNDIAGMGPRDARLAAYCNPKGRMLGNLIAWRETAEPDAAFLAIVKADVAETMANRLKMFVLRAKVRFESTALKVYGMSRTLEANHTAEAGTGLSPAANEAWLVEREAAFTRISAPAMEGGPARWWVVGADDAESMAATTGLRSTDAATWRAQDIQAGLGWVEQANVERFIPQSLNYDLIGGVSFTKGCYPGQEVVARAHFRGAVKRRAVPARCLLPTELSLEAGADIFDAQRPAAAAGRIINATPDTPGAVGAMGWALLMEVNLADIGRADFRAHSPEGPAVQLSALPYPLEVKE